MPTFKLLNFLILTVGLFHFESISAIALEPPVVRLSMESEPLSMDWHARRTAVDRFIVSFLMRGLLRYDGNSKPICDLCRKFTVSEDGKIYRFDLKTETQWSDGIRLDAKQFVDSFRRLLDPANGFKAAEEFKIIEGAVQQKREWDFKKLAVRAESPEVLEIQLNQALAYFPDLLTSTAAFPIRRDLIKDKTGESHAREAVLGPYQLAEWQKGKRIVIEGNAKYQDTRPVYRVEFVVGARPLQVERFKQGKIDILSNPTTEDLLKISSRQMQVNPYWATRVLVLSTKTKPTSDLAFRRALLYGLERESLPPYLKNGERRVTGMIPPGLKGYRELPLVTPDFTMAQAERNRAVGWPKVLDLKVLIRNTATEKQVGQWLSEQLDKIKIRAILQTKEERGYFKDLEAGKFEAALATVGFDVANPTDMLRSYTSHSASNRGGWAHVAYDRLIEQMIGETNPTEFEKRLDQATQLLEVQEVAVIPLGYPTLPFLLGPRVQRFTVTPFGDPDLVNIQLKQ